MKILITFIFLLSILISCGQNNEIKKVEKYSTQQIINTEGKTIEARINTPAGFIRNKFSDNTFEYYLRNLPLKPDSSKVHYYDGGLMTSDQVYVAVVDMEIGNKDLQQCADAVIRLRAEYLYRFKQFDKIHFNFTDGFRADYVKWAEGYRFVINGTKVSYIRPENTVKNDYSYKTFRSYLNKVFAYVGTFSLAKELKTKDYKDLNIGDVFIRGGLHNNGHAEIIVDVAVNPKTGKKIFILAQSFTPAQDIHILSNPSNKELSPWYEINDSDDLICPEVIFKWTDLKCF